VSTLVSHGVLLALVDRYYHKIQTEI